MIFTQFVFVIFFFNNLQLISHVWFFQAHPDFIIFPPHN